MALAIGPKTCDMELKDFKSLRVVGRVQFEVGIRQVQLMEIALEDMQGKVGGKEDRHVHAQFKVINNHGADSGQGMNRVSDKTETVKGRFKKTKNQTFYKWKDSKPCLKLEVSLDTLKTSTI